MKATVKLLLVTIVTVSSISATDTMDQMIALWTQKRYDVVLPQLRQYRKQPLGRKWQVDYMIGTSVCHSTGDRHQGVAYLSNVFAYKGIPDTARTATEQEIKFCLQTTAVTRPEQPSFDLVPIGGQVTSPASVEGKGGYNFIRANGVVTNTKEAVTPIPITELKKRVFGSDRSDEALKAASARLPGKTKGLVANGFVIVCSGYCEFPLRDVTDCLERFKKPLRSQFQMLLPTDLITVYVPQDLYFVQQYANQLHGIQLPLGTVAYSVLEDLSMVGIAGQGCGSLAHELTHLSIRSNFGDSPAWLEEGLASEIAVGSPVGDSFRFGPSWRDTTLREQWDLRPTVAKLMAMNWSDFAATDQDSVRRVAAIHAMAAVFVRYLDQKHKLNPVYFAIRDGRFLSDSAERRTDASIVEEQLGMNLAHVDADFVKWFGYKPPPQIR